MIEKVIKKDIIYHGIGIDFFCDEIELPNSTIVKREYISHPGAAAILPFIDKENIILVKQYRYPIGQVTYEIPAGKINEGETPLECAIRELEEETGYRAKKLEKILSFYPTVAFSNEIIYVFVAFDFEIGKQIIDEDEFVLREIVSFKEAIKMIKTGKIMDSKTIIALIYFENIFEYKESIL
ncbi:MAG: NUDIX hydrolase [Endomicrobium sp.]|jgi:ADP-ribose pyrophosphatase|nr:NUDIX hydrolase [Endomicrobium sp.]